MTINEAAHLSREWQASLDAAIAQAQADGKRLAQHATDEINNQIGFWIRSDSQKRRYEKAKKELQK